MKTHQELATEYWNEFYKSDQVTHDPSDFAKFVNNYCEGPSTLMDIGCGNCRDSYFFSSVGHNVISVDKSFNENLFNSKNGFFIKSGIEDLSDIKTKIIYSRFFIHAIPEEVEDAFLNYIKRNCELFFIEARSDKSSFDGDHYRRFINKDRISDKLSNLGFKFIEEDYGLAVFEDQDPCIIRIVGRTND